MAKFKNFEVTLQFLDQNPDCYVVFGDNLQRCGKGGAAKLRSHSHAIGFITKKFPDNNDGSFYRVDEYKPIFVEELVKLVTLVKSRPEKTFYITKLGSGLANRYHIWEDLIKDNLIRALEVYDNVVFCWKED